MWAAFLAWLRKLFTPPEEGGFGEGGFGEGDFGE